MDPAALSGCRDFHGLSIIPVAKGVAWSPEGQLESRCPLALMHYGEDGLCVPWLPFTGSQHPFYGVVGTEGHFHRGFPASHSLSLDYEMENHWLVLAKGEVGTESREQIPSPITWAFTETAGDKPMN